MIWAQPVNRFGPYSGLKLANLESSTNRSTTSFMSKGFRMSGFTIENMSSIGCLGAIEGRMECNGWLRDFSVLTPFASLSNRIKFVDSNLICETSDSAMDPCTTQLLGVNLSRLLPS